MTHLRYLSVAATGGGRSDMYRDVQCTDAYTDALEDVGMPMVRDDPVTTDLKREASVLNNSDVFKERQYADSPTDSDRGYAD